LHATPRDVQYRNIKLRKLPFQEAPAAKPQTYLEGSLEPLTAAVEQNPLDPDAWIRRGRWHAVRQNWKDARTDYESYLQLKPENTFIRRQHAELCLALQDNDLQSYVTVTERVRSLPTGAWAFDDLRTLCLIPPPKGLTPSNLVEWAARSKQPTGWAKMYSIPVHYRAGDFQTCVAASSELFPNGPQQLFQALPCLAEAAALKQLGKDAEARRKLLAVRDFVEQGKSQSYQGKRDDIILYLTFDALHAQVFYREASELILGVREELKAPLALEIVNRESPGK
jgi:tetratricopeptide (TPR) repeat protein